MADAAELVVKGRRFAFSTDSYVVKPLFFPGGDIGKLAVCGTVNDLSMKGARPLYLSLALIIEEGLPVEVLDRIADSVRLSARAAGVKIVTGDLKVVEKGSCDGIFINTAGVGVIEGRPVGVKARSGDVIILNGPIAEHGSAVLNAREGFGFSSSIKSDCRNLNFEAARCMAASRKISVMRDLTRGGLATSLCEIASSSNLGIDVYEKEVPVKNGVRRFCDALGLDPFYVANEGKFVCAACERDASKILKALPAGAKAIGRVTRLHKKETHLITSLGARRMLPMLESEQLPRIC